MGRSRQAAGAAAGQRIDWVDYAKGFCIVFVVTMHSTLGVENVFNGLAELPAVSCCSDWPVRRRWFPCRCCCRKAV